MLQNLKAELSRLANPKKARILQRFFKTGKGEYGKGDIFLGIVVPVQRSVAKKYKDISLKEIRELLRSKVHEHRLVSLMVLGNKFAKSNEDVKEHIVDFYLKNTKFVNNWDLVDSSADRILGNYLLDKDKEILDVLAKSVLLWERRIAIIATFAFIKRNRFDYTFKVSEMLLEDKHDLIHKAVGWMLREVGKRDQNAEEEFLRKHYKKMPRTMLRYAIERFSDEKKKLYMQK